MQYCVYSVGISGSEMAVGVSPANLTSGVMACGSKPLFSARCAPFLPPTALARALRYPAPRCALACFTRRATPAGDGRHDDGIRCFVMFIRWNIRWAFSYCYHSPCIPYLSVLLWKTLFIPLFHSDILYSVVFDSFVHLYDIFVFLPLHLFVDTIVTCCCHYRITHLCGALLRPASGTF